jgi:hypothetical protein
MNGTTFKFNAIGGRGQTQDTSTGTQKVASVVIGMEAKKITLQHAQ